MKDNYVLIACRVDQETHERLIRLAKHEDRSVSSMMRLMIREYFDRMDANDDE